MALFSNTARELAQRVGRLYLNDWRSGTITATAGADKNKTFIDSTRWEQDNFFNQTTPVSFFRVLTTTDGAAPQGEEKPVTSWTLATTTGVLTSALTADIEAGDTYVLLSTWRWAEVIEALNAAIDKVKTRQLIEKIDETTVLREDKYEYNIPSGFSHIYRVTMQDSDGNFTEEIPQTHYVIVRAGTTPQIKFLRLGTDGKFSGIPVHGYWADDYLTAGKLIISDCETVWSDIDTDVTASLDTSDKKVGNSSLKLAVAAGAAAGDVLALDTITELDLTGRTYTGLWLKSSTALVAGDLQLILSDGTSDLETLNIPATDANTWTYHTMALSDPTKLHAITKVSVKMVNDKGVFNLWVDDVAAPTTIRIEGLQTQSKLTTDSSVCYLNPDFICSYAGYLLNQMKTRRTDTDPDDFGVRAQACLRESREAERTLSTKLPPNTKRVDL